METTKQRPYYERAEFKDQIKLVILGAIAMILFFSGCIGVFVGSFVIALWSNRYASVVEMSLFGLGGGIIAFVVILKIDSVIYLYKRVTILIIN